MVLFGGTKGYMPTNTLKTGLAGVTIAIKRICTIVKRFGPSLTAAINAAAASGKITTAQAAQAEAFISSAVAACDIFRAASGY